MNPLHAINLVITIGVYLVASAYFYSDEGAGN